MAKQSGGRRGPSLAQVAEIAGVSISTVSKVANGNPDVAEETRARVAGILSEHRYVATKKRKATGPRIALMFRSMRMPNSIDLSRGALEAAATAGMPVEFTLYSGAPGWVDVLKSGGIRGLVAVSSVLTGAERERLTSAGIELVVVNPMGAPHRGSYSIGATNWTGGVTAVEHLLELGHRRIALLRGDDQTMVSQSRVSGYLAALSAAGVDPSELWQEPGDFTYESGLAVADRLLAGPERPSAIVAASDFQALGVIEAARRAGLRVPVDLSVVGFDDLVLAGMSSPPLTTVRQPLDQMGAAAVRMLADLLAGREPQSHHIELATSLVVRDSTAAPADR